MEMSNEQVTQEFFHSLNNSYYKAAVKEFEYRLKKAVLNVNLVVINYQKWKLQ